MTLTLSASQTLETGNSAGCMAQYQINMADRSHDIIVGVEMWGLQAVGRGDSRVRIRISRLNPPTL